MSTRPRPAAKPPKLAAVVNDDEVQAWDEYVKEATPDVATFRKRLPDDTLLEVPCPTSGAMDALAEAQGRGDVPAMFLAVFGEEKAPDLLRLTEGLPFTVRIRLINDVMFHYGMSLGQLPESAASPR